MVTPKTVLLVPRQSPSRKRIYISTVYVFDCRHCGREFSFTAKTLRGRTGEHCSVRCAAQSRDIARERHPNWRGGVVMYGGYRYVLRAGHPNANKRGYVAEHRYAMAQHIGRPLLRTEMVHHINGCKTDNRIENLVLVQNQTEHTAAHGGVLHKRRRGEFVVCGICGKMIWRQLNQIQRTAQPFCSRRHYWDSLKAAK